MIRFVLRSFMLCMLLFVMAARFGLPALLASEISSIELVELANADRQKHNLAPLQYNKKLERAAFEKAENMFKEQYWAHYGPHNESPWQFILGAGYTYTYAGENLAKGFSDTSSVHDAWMASPTHRANIMDPQFQEVGIAVVQGNLQGSEIFLVVQMFGSTGNAPSATPGKLPFIKLQQPQDGDILEEGITDIRGDAGNLEQPLVSLYINKAFVGGSIVEGGSFDMQAQTSAAQGDQVITVKAAGESSTPLSDSIVVTIVSKDDTTFSLAKCLSIIPGASQTVVKYTCEAVLTEFSITVGSVRYTKSIDKNEVIIPVNTLPKDSGVSVVAAASFADGSTQASPLKVTSLRVGTFSDESESGGILGFMNVTSSSLRMWGYAAFGIALALLIAYAIEAAIKKQLLQRRFEIFAYLLLLAILFIAFNFGYVRV